jgi:hypothetical protein
MIRKGGEERNREFFVVKKKRCCLDTLFFNLIGLTPTYAFLNKLSFSFVLYPAERDEDSDDVTVILYIKSTE